MLLYKAFTKSKLALDKVINDVLLLHHMKVAIHTNRTQISLSTQLKALIKSQGALYGESLSEYLRKAALLRLALEEMERKELELTAEAVIGSIPKDKSGWKKIKDVSKWQRQERKREEIHRS